MLMAACYIETTSTFSF